MSYDNIKQFLDELLAKSTPEKPAWNLEVVLGHIEPSWNYIDGCMIKSVLEMYYITKDTMYLDFADGFIDAYVNDDGSIRGYQPSNCSCDDVNEGKVLFDLYRITGKEKYRMALDTVYGQLAIHPRTQGGNFWHKQFYPNQIWLDGLYMVQPFYMEYENTFNGNKNTWDICRQFDNVYTLMRDRDTELLYHGYDEARQSIWADKQTGLSPNFWTRSLGWYAMALVDTLEKMDAQLVKERATLQKYLLEISEALARVRDDKSNMFYQVPTMGGREGNYLETSGTCAIAYTMMKGARLGYLPAKFAACGEEIIQAVIKDKLLLQGDTFVLKDICLVAGLGVLPGRGTYKERDGTYEYYISEPRVDNDAKGVAPFLLAFTELYRLGQ